MKTALDRKQTRKIVQSIVLSVLAVCVVGMGMSTATLALGPAGDGKTALTPLIVNPNSYEDPAEVFQRWRIQNRVTLPAPPFVLQAHEQWLKYQGHYPSYVEGALPAYGSVAEAATVGTNVCLQNANSPTGVPSYQGEVTIAVNPNNAQQIVAGANTFYQDATASCHSPTGGASQTYGTQALYASTNGGQTWNYNCAPWPSSLTGGVSGATQFFGSDPTVAWDSNGNAYATYMLISASNSTNGAAIVVAKSTNAGTSWSSLGIVVNNISNTSNFDDKEMMAIDITSGKTYSHTNRIYVIWDENNVERVAYSDNGTSWTIVVVDSSGGDIGGDLAIGADGTVYAVWNRYSQTGGVGAGDTLMFAKSVNGGSSWTSPAAVVTHNLASFGSNNKPPAQDQRGINAFPAIAVDTDSGSAYFGTIYIVYCDFPPSVGSGANLNTYCIHSANGGGTWTSQLQVNDDAVSATHIFPWVAVDESSGAVNVSWYDTRNDSVNNRKTQVFYARSTNGGTSFSANQQVTQASGQFNNTTTNYSDENSADNANYNANQYGDYAQIAASSGNAWPIWTDSRQFYPTNSGSQTEDAASATITSCAVPGTPTIGTVTVPGNNQLTVSWTAGSPAGSTYSIYRSTGACPGGTFAQVKTGQASSPWTDTTVSGGVTYSYEVTAVDSTGGCESAQSGCAQGTATGTCTAAPTFAGITSVTNPQNTTCTLALGWTAGTSNCSGTVSYNVYRNTTSPFTPGSGNRIATGVATTSYSDSNNLTSGTAYYYIVRAVDSANGNEDTNTVTQSGTPTGPITTSTLTDTFEGTQSGGGFDLAGWTHGAVTGTTDWAWSTAQHHDGTHSWFAKDIASVSDMVLISPSFGVGATTTLSFYHTYAFESGYDGGTLEYSTNGGSTWTMVPVADYTLGAPSTVIPTTYSNPIGNETAWSGGTVGTMTQVVVNLHGDANMLNKTVQIRWHEGNDDSNASTGWYVDTVVISNAQTMGTCTTVSGPPGVQNGISGTAMKGTRAAADGSQISVTWDNSCAGTQYEIVYGGSAQLPTSYSGTYGLTGVQCSIGSSGSYSWTGVPAVPGGSSYLWWLVVATDGATTEGSWGKNSSQERTGPGTGGSSQGATGACATTKSLVNTCGQ